MKKSVKMGLIFLLIVMDIIISLVLYKNNLINYLIVSGTILFVLVLLLIIVLVKKTNKEDAYNSSLNKILKIYDAILVQSNNFPDFKDKTIIRVNDFEDMIDAQIELRKPIIFKKQIESCSFILLDQNQALVYIKKLSNDALCPLEIILKEIETQKQKKEDYDYSILKDIDKTTIVKLENNKSYKVSPVRKKTKKDEYIEIL